MQDENYNIESQDPEEKEIDLLELFGKLWNAKRTLIWAGVAGLVIGLVVAFSIPKEYTVDMKLAPEISGGTKVGGGGLSALASMAGINLSSGSGTDAVNPTLYPEIVSSVPFVTGLFDVPVTTKDDEHMTLRDYLEYKTSSPWWSSIMTLPGKAIGAVRGLFTEPVDTAKQYQVDPFRLSFDQTELVKKLNAAISADVDTKTAVISVSVTMHDPLVSALLVDTVVHRLQEYVTDYRTEKARNDLAYAQKINDEAKTEYHKAQQRYANFVDRNHGLVTRASQTEEERLQNETNLAYTLYSNTLQQYQLARAKVQEITPVYTVLKPATVPIQATKPSKIVILIGFIFLAVVIAGAWILFGQDFVASLRKATAKEPEGEGSH